MIARGEEHDTHSILIQRCQKSQKVNRPGEKNINYAQ